MVIAEARRRFEISERDPKGVSPAVRQTALSIVARNADAETPERFVARLRATKDPLQQQVLLRAMDRIHDPSGAQRMLELVIGPDAPAGAAARIIDAVAAEYPDLVWDFALQHAAHCTDL